MLAVVEVGNAHQAEDPEHRLLQENTAPPSDPITYEPALKVLFRRLHLI